METLLNWDTQILLLVNSWHTPFWDVVMYWISHKFFWIPFYAVLLFLLYKRSPREFMVVVPVLLLMILFIDQGSVHLFKEVFERLRPCHEPAIQNALHLPDGCGGQYGFISSHAANSFGLAVFVSLLLRKKYSFFKYGGMYYWAALVAYSRMYLGAHYLGDLLFGAAFGGFIGYTAYCCVPLINKYLVKLKNKKV